MATVPRAIVKGKLSIVNIILLRKTTGNLRMIHIGDVSVDVIQSFTNKQAYRSTDLAAVLCDFRGKLLDFSAIHSLTVSILHECTDVIARATYDKEDNENIMTQLHKKLALMVSLSFQT